LPVTNLNANYAPFVNQYGVLKTSRALFVIPPLHPGVFRQTIDLYYFISAVFVTWFTTDTKHLTGRIPGID